MKKILTLSVYVIIAKMCFARGINLTYYLNRSFNTPTIKILDNDDTIKRSKSFSIVADIKDLPDTEIKLITHGARQDTFKVMSRRGKFTFTGTLDTISPYWESQVLIKIKSEKLRLFFINGDALKIQGDFNNWPIVKITNAPSNDVFLSFMKGWDSLYKQRDKDIVDISELNKIVYSLTGQKDWSYTHSLSIDMHRAYKVLDISGNPDTLTIRNRFAQIQDQRKKLNTSIKNSYKLSDEIGFKSLSQHADSYYSLGFIRIKLEEAKLREDTILLEKIRHAYKGLSLPIKNSDFGQVIGKQLAIGIMPSFVPGRIAKDFGGRDANGQLIFLSDVLKKNKYTLVDFWASWCAPCKAQFPFLKKTYDLYKDKGFQILALSVDDKEEVWKITLTKNTLPWLNIRDLRGTPQSAEVIYKLNHFPTNYLIDSKGLIVAEDLRDDELENTIRKFINQSQ